MKKIFLVALLIANGIAWASGFGKTWTIVTIGNGSTTLKAAQAGSKVHLKRMLVSVQNACNLYLYEGTAGDLTRLSNTFYFSAQSGYAKTDIEQLDIVTTSGEALKLWASADPGTNIMIQCNYLKDA